MGIPFRSSICDTDDIPSGEKEYKDKPLFKLVTPDRVWYMCADTDEQQVRSSLFLSVCLRISASRDSSRPNSSPFLLSCRLVDGMVGSTAGGHPGHILFINHAAGCAYVVASRHDGLKRCQNALTHPILSFLGIDSTTPVSCPYHVGT